MVELAFRTCDEFPYVFEGGPTGAAAPALTAPAFPPRLRRPVGPARLGAPMRAARSLTTLRASWPRRYVAVSG